MDRLAWEQEYRAEFVSFAGQAYYAWDTDKHAVGRLRYDPRKPLILAMDFNKSPGVAAILQELPAPSWAMKPGELSTCLLDEIWIQRNSNTKRVCSHFLEKYRHHPSELKLYGDPAGGASGSQSVEGSDWDLAWQALRPTFGHRLEDHVARAHPRERVRMNAVNSRLESVAGDVRMYADRNRCTNIIRDFEGTTTTEDGKKIHKPQGTVLTHLTDAIGYYMNEAHPCGAGAEMTVTAL